MIDLRKYEVGQRFKTRGGREAVILFFCDSVHTRVLHGDKMLYHYSNGEYNGAFARYDLIRPIYSVPANTRRIPSAKLMPTGYQKQWPHLYQMGGGA